MTKRNVVAGLDMSYDILMPAKAKALWDAGYRVFAQCLWTGIERPLVRLGNLRAAADQGFILIGYISITTRGGASDVVAARDGVPDDLWARLSLTPIDVELPGISDDTVRAAVEITVDLGKRRCIYTSYNHWIGRQRNSTAFMDCLLWDASWDGDPAASFLRRSYGGWTPEQVVGKQYTGGEYVSNVFADKDVFDLDLLVPEEVGRMKYTDEQLDQTFTSILQTLGRALDIASTTAAALINHVYTHPNGGGTQTMIGEIATLQEKQQALQKSIDDFKAGVAAAAGAGQ